jgi:tripartite-type tricarboxylate transporter receptor subunit TctC
VTTAKRSPALPDVPAIGEFVLGYEASTSFGVGAPKNTPIEIVGKLNKEINTALTNSRLQVKLTELAGMLLPGSPSDFGTLIAEETEKWAKVVKFASLKPE